MSDIGHLTKYLRAGESITFDPEVGPVKITLVDKSVRQAVLHIEADKRIRINHNRVEVSTPTEFIKSEATSGVVEL